jgi:hypothetical protein
MSLISIMESLAAQGVSATGRTPTPYLFETLPNGVVPTASLPCRLIYTGDVQDYAATFVAMGKLTHVPYRILDLMLWTPTAQNVGRTDIERPLAEYAHNYHMMLRSWRNAGQSEPDQAVLTAFIPPAPGIYSWPPQSNTLYWGVMCGVQVDEYFAGA